MKEALIDERDTENSAQCWELCSTKQVKKWLTTVQQAKRVTNQYEIFVLHVNQVTNERQFAGPTFGRE